MSAAAKQRRQKQQQLVRMDDVKAWADMSGKERVVHATKQTSYVGVVVAGFAVTAVLGYAIASELLGGTDSASAVYSRALDTLQHNDNVKQVLGHPVKGYREHRRGGEWKRFNEYEADPRTGLRSAFMRFGVSGSVAEATANVWLIETAPKSGKWEFRHLNIESPGRGRVSMRVIVVDNQHDSADDHISQEYQS